MRVSVECCHVKHTLKVGRTRKMFTSPCDLCSHSICRSPKLPLVFLFKNLIMSSRFVSCDSRRGRSPRQLSHRNQERKSNCFSINLQPSSSKLYLNPARLLTIYNRIDSVIVSSAANQKTAFVIEHK